MYKKLRELRIKHNISGVEMAKFLNITKASYSKKELGSVKFSLNEAKLISDKFNRSIEDIFFENKVSKIETNTVVKVVVC
ncbi:helix-turn-helix transcriptional regulator [Clostridium tyrobutyricum]|uniref:helix-turn-helix transcriptional regulator n=1 Tax=Clostridium tyrobutyricum TaxID=1519 RepID=UPI001C39383C|nr:helix-turn-helix domain-containing protein [Clostridium tyrobutyricum]